MSLLMVGPTLSANSVPTLWGIDEDDDELFSIDDYTQIGGSAVLTSYGILKYDRDGVITDLTCDSSGAHIGSFTLDGDGVAYMALNCALDFQGTVNDLDAPVLLKFDTADASTSVDNVVDIVGQIPIVGFDEPTNSDNISGLSFDPISGTLFALYRVHSDPTPDRLLIINQGNATVMFDLGTMTGLGGEVVEDGEDLEFDEEGNLYVTDNQDEHLYRVNPNTSAIEEIVDANEDGGLGVGSVKIEGLVWDPERDQLVGSDDLNELFFIYDLTQDGNNSPLGSVAGLTDVEALDIAIELPPPAVGRMTGGGHQLSVDGARVTKGLTLHCDITLSNNLEINWPGGNNWHLEKESLTEVQCIDTIVNQEPPAAPFDTFIAEAVGSLNGVPGSIIRFTFVDAGEPGRNDSGIIDIWAPGVDPDGAIDPVLSVDETLRGGNFQAHFDQPHK